MDWVQKLFRQFLLEKRVLKRAPMASVLLLAFGAIFGGGVMYFWDKDRLEIADRQSKWFETQYNHLRTGKRKPTKEKNVEADEPETKDMFDVNAYLKKNQMYPYPPELPPRPNPLGDGRYSLTTTVTANSTLSKPSVEIKNVSDRSIYLDIRSLEIDVGKYNIFDEPFGKYHLPPGGSQTIVPRNELDVAVEQSGDEVNIEIQIYYGFSEEILSNALRDGFYCDVDGKSLKCRHTYNNDWVRR